MCGTALKSTALCAKLPFQLQKLPPVHAMQMVSKLLPAGNIPGIKAPGYELGRNLAIHKQAGKMMKQNFFIEKWPEADNLHALASNISVHLQVRQHLGNAVVFTDRPVVFLSTVRKQWLKLERTLLSERSRTLDTRLRATFTRELDYMAKLRFSAQVSEKAQVIFMALSEFSHLPPTCRTIYIPSSAPEPEKLGRFLIPPEGSVVVYYSLK